MFFISYWIYSIYQSVSGILLTLHLLKATCNRSLLYLSNKEPKFIPLTFLPRTVLIVTHLLLLPSQTIRIVIWWWLITYCCRHGLLYIYDLHLLIYSLLCVLLLKLFLLVTLVFLSNRCVSFGTYFERFDRILGPWLQTADLRVVNTESIIVWSIEERYGWYWSVFTEWEDIRVGLFWVISYESNIELIIVIIVDIQIILFHWIYIF